MCRFRQGVACGASGEALVAQLACGVPECRSRHGVDRHSVLIERGDLDPLVHVRSGQERTSTRLNRALYRPPIARDENRRHISSCDAGGDICLIGSSSAHALKSERIVVGAGFHHRARGTHRPAGGFVAGSRGSSPFITSSSSQTPQSRIRPLCPPCAIAVK
jgi:hypothetical protein